MRAGRRITMSAMTQTVLLAIDTSTEFCSVALLAADGPTADAASFRTWVRHERTGAVSSTRVLPAVREVLDEAGLAFADCNAIAFGAGPGSFTGLRTATGVAQGLAFGRALPVVPVGTLLACAEAAPLNAGAAAGRATRVRAALDARMDEVYWADYAWDDAAGDWQALGVARVVERRTDGRLLVDDGYIPPRLVAQRDPVLLRHTRELHGLLTQRSEALGERLSEPGRGGVSEVADFLLLQLVNRYLALTWHAQQDVAAHPETLFCDWLKLACDLSTFTAAGRRPQSLAVYRHDDLRASFGELMAELRRSLSTVLEQNAIQIELRDVGNGMKVATIADPALRDTAGFVLAVRADVPADSLRARFPAQAKLGPVERIRDLVQLQLPGIAMRQLPVAPRQIPYHAGHTYFEIDKGGEMWKQLERSGGLAFHFAGEFPGLSMEFWAIRG